MSSVYSLERLSKDILTSDIFKASLVFEVLFENYRHSFEHRNNYVNRLFYRSIYHFTIVYWASKPWVEARLGVVVCIWHADFYHKIRSITPEVYNTWGYNFNFYNFSNIDSRFIWFSQHIFGGSFWTFGSEGQPIARKYSWAISSAVLPGHPCDGWSFPVKTLNHNVLIFHQLVIDPFSNETRRFH